MPHSLVTPALAVALLAAVAGYAAAAQTRTQTLRLISTPTSQSVTDLAPRTAAQGRLTKGDTIRGTSSLANAVRQLGKAKGARVGSDGFVISVAAPPNARIMVHVTLPGGTLSATGVFDVATNVAQSIRIIGGTGAFKGARGTASSSGLSDGRSLNVYILQLP